MCTVSALSHLYFTLRAELGVFSALKVVLFKNVADKHEVILILVSAEPVGCTPEAGVGWDCGSFSAGVSVSSRGVFDGPIPRPEESHE